ncbi:DUF4287 domain-containing protein [Lipingzhangella sp. LS1_29]|uniref:DUF4287 domain-containing protein n=1 Tax=Lipingzhangella rawalii TaxID=2055835 RepID=A0ABU2H2J6_9ACTN|nr:DUF4287 domain-containing protein [Lipingzhangella rawalii]MDS1269085.1 DUF4287 domain-containing protein [Lipingzhangella rawalii]
MSTNSPDPSPPDDGPPTSEVGAVRYSAETIRRTTGRPREEWFALLDAWGALSRSHAEIARWLTEHHQVPGWWAQTLTVAYEQDRGIRAPGQRRDGTFSATASRTLNVPAELAFAAFADPQLRQRWLPDVSLSVRRESAPRNFRADVVEDSSRLVVGITAKGPSRCQVSVEQERLADAAAAAHSKTRWRERLAVLSELMDP